MKELATTMLSKPSMVACGMAPDVSSVPSMPQKQMAGIRVSLAFAGSSPASLWLCGTQQRLDVQQ